MNKTELIKEISRLTGISSNKTSRIIDSLLKIITESVKEGDKVSLHRFGAFKKIEKSERRYFSIHNNRTEIKGKKSSVKFVPFKQFRRTVIRELEASNNLVKQRVVPIDSSRGVFTNSQVNESNENKTRLVPKASKNLGARRFGDTSEYHNNRFEYIGKVLYDHYLGEDEHTSYPAVKTPLKGTNILGWYRSNKEAVVGVSEPLLVDEVEKLCQKYEGLVLLQNVALPIRNREYSYRPDIALWWEKYEILIDIEIDEPYDICSRKPLHYIGCSDNLRDQYFIRNGWTVIRYSENQVTKHMTELIGHLEFVLNWLSNKATVGYIPFEAKRWTYEEAIEISSAAQRERDLELKAQHKNTINQKQAIGASYDNFIKPNSDILPEIGEVSHDSLIESQLKYVMASCAAYVRITDLDGREWVFDKESIKTETKEDGTYIVGNNILIPFLKNYSIKSTKKVEAISSLYTEDHWSSEDNVSNRDILIKAAKLGSPIWIKYCNGQGSKSERYLSNLSLFLHHIDAQTPFTDLGSIVIKNKSQWEYHLWGFCSLRYEFRQFACDSRLSEVKIVNCKNAYIWGNAYQASLAELVMNPYSYRFDFFNRVDYLIDIMPSKEKESTLSKGNLAHYEVIKGNIEKALEMYLAIPYDTYMGESGDMEYVWGTACIEDIEKFINEGKNTKDSSSFEIMASEIVENFSKIKSLLITHGWNWNK